MQSNSRYQSHSFSHYETEDAWIADLDPVVEGVFKVAHFEPQLALQVRYSLSGGQRVSVKGLYAVRILCVSNGEGVYDLKIQISSEQDLFKLYLCRLDEKQFQKMRRQQSLNFSFQALPAMLVKQMNLCKREPDNYNAVLSLNQVSAHQFTLLENIEYKRIELLSLQFEAADEELIKNYVTFKFTKIKMNKQIIEKKLKDVLSMTKIKNHNLWADIVKKSASRVTK